MGSGDPQTGRAGGQMIHGIQRRRLGLRKGRDRSMTQHMKSPRDILVAGIGFVLGMVFCYFIIASKISQPERGSVTFVYGSFGSTAAATNAVDLERLKLNWN